MVTNGNARIAALKLAQEHYVWANTMGAAADRACRQASDSGARHLLPALEAEADRWDAETDRAIKAVEAAKAALPW